MGCYSKVIHWDLNHRHFVGLDIQWWISWMPNHQAESKFYAWRGLHLFLVRSQTVGHQANVSSSPRVNKLESPKNTCPYFSETITQTSQEKQLSPCYLKHCHCRERFYFTQSKKTCLNSRTNISCPRHFTSLDTAASSTGDKNILTTQILSLY